MANVDDVLVDSQRLGRLPRGKLRGSADVSAVTSVELSVEKADVRLRALLEAGYGRLVDVAFLLHFAVVYITYK